MGTLETNKKRIAQNSLLLYVRMFITMLMGLITSRLVLDALGVIDYGIYNVVGGVTSMFVFLNTTMSVATSRFIAFAIGENNKKKLCTIYNQARIIHYGIGLLVLVLIESFGQWMVYNKLNLPYDRVTASILVLHSVSVVTILNIMSTPDMALIIAYERMKSFAYISIFDSTMKLLATIVLVFFSGDKLIFYAILVTMIQVVDRIFYLVYCRRNFEEAKCKLRFDRPVFRKMFSFAGWNLLGNLSVMTIEQGMSVLLNIFCGPAINAARGLSTSLSNYVAAFANNARMAINPQITKSYAENNLAFMHKLIALSSISFFYILILIAVPLYFVIDYILKMWLIDVHEYTSVFFKLTMAYLLVNSFANPIIIGIHATGNIKRFQIVEGAIMLLTLPSAYISLSTGMSPPSVYISMIVFAILTQIGRLYIILPKIKMPFREYLCTVIRPSTTVLVSSIFMITLYHLSLTHINQTITYDFACAVISFVILTNVILFLGLTKSERDYLYKSILKHK